MMKKILLIDDELVYRNMLRSYLENNDFIVYDVPSGHEADIVLQSVDDIDMVITDLMMPGEHGIDLMIRIREKYKIPVLVISGVYDQDLLKEDDIDFSDGFLKKPFELEELKKKVIELLNR